MDSLKCGLLTKKTSLAAEATREAWTTTQGSNKGANLRLNFTQTQAGQLACCSTDVLSVHLRRRFSSYSVRCT